MRAKCSRSASRSHSTAFCRYRSLDTFMRNLHVIAACPVVQTETAANVNRDGIGAGGERRHVARAAQWLELRHICSRTHKQVEQCLRDHPVLDTPVARVTVTRAAQQ